MTGGSPARRPRIAIYGQPEYFRFTYEHDLDDWADVFELKMQMGMQPADFDELVAFDADYNIFYRGEFVPAQVLNRLRGAKVALSSEPFPRVVDGRLNWTADSVRRYMVFRAIRELPYDYVFHYDAASLPVAAWDGLHLSGHFPLPVATRTYCPQPVAPEWDLFFIGRSTPHRESHFGLLKHRHQFLHICHGVWGPPLVDYMARARICLNVHAEDEVSWEPRMQMMLACDTFVLSERITPNPYLRPGVDYVEVGSPREMHEAVAHYLAHPAERERIARAGGMRVRELLAARESFAALVAGIEDGRHPRVRMERAATAMKLASTADVHWARFRGRVGRLLGV